jgi:hypothetical protein
VGSWLLKWWANQLQSNKPQGEQVAVKSDLCYLVSFVTFQLICHLLEAKLPISRPARIKIRQITLMILVALTIVVSKE